MPHSRDKLELSSDLLIRSIVAPSQSEYFMGTVREVHSDGLLLVELIAKRDCHACANGQGCGAGLFARLLLRKLPVTVVLANVSEPVLAQYKIRVQPDDLAEALVGARVRVRLPDDLLPRQSLGSFFIPIVLLVLGSIAGHVLAGGIGLAAGLAADLGALFGAILFTTLYVLRTRVSGTLIARLPLNTPQNVNTRDAVKPVVSTEIQVESPAGDGSRRKHLNAVIEQILPAQESLSLSCEFNLQR